MRKTTIHLAKSLYACIRVLPLCLSLFLVACGPKEIGQGTDEPAADYHEATAADHMRYPMTGASDIDKRLYYFNQPEIMEKLQKGYTSSWKRQMGLNPEHPSYRSVPQQRSPFRQ